MITYHQPLLAFAVPKSDLLTVVEKRLPLHKDLLTVGDMAVAADVSTGVVLRWLDDGRLPSAPFGAGHTRAFHKVTRTNFLEFINNRAQGLS